MNDLDSEQMGRALSSQGYDKTDCADNADLILINTCSVREKPAQKLYSDIGRYRHLKMKNPNLVLGVTGCQAKVDGDGLLKRFSYLDLVLGPDQSPDLIQYLSKIRSGQGRQSDIRSLPKSDYRFVELVENTHESAFKAYVNIMKGCDNFCSFCIVPFTRGREISRSSEEILKEINVLVKLGALEVTLLGQNVNSYGNKRVGEISFAQLLAQIAQQTSLKRLRFTTSHPKDLSEALIEEFHSNPILAPQMHLPVQSGSNLVLEKMYRGYTVEEYEEKLSRLRAACPDIALSTDIIVGFPGETEEAFQETLDLMKRVQYDSLFAFHYSPRPKTTAAKFFDDDVSLETKKARLQRLLDLQAEINYKKNLARVGKEEVVLMESFSKMGNTLQGRTEHNRIIHVLGNESMIGQFYKVKVMDASPYALKGETLSQVEELAC